MKIYCQKCNQPTDYVSIKPKFCTACGCSFCGKPAAKEQADTEATANHEQEPVNVPRINQLDVEILKFESKGSSLKDILLSGLEGPRSYDRPHETDINKVREEWKKEASSRGRSDSTEINEEIKD